MSTTGMTMAQFNTEVQEHNLKRFKNLLMGDQQKLDKFVSSMAHCVSKTPKLLQASKESLLDAFVKCAELDLYPSSISGECFILPYDNNKKLADGTWEKTTEAQFQLGYQGVVTLLYRAGVQFIDSNIVCRNDPFDIEEGSTPRLYHKPDPFMSSKDRGEPAGAYVLVTMNGHTAHKWMNKDDILKFKAFSKSKDSKYSPWLPENDPQLWMWRKTVLKQFGKTLPKNAQIHKALEYDNVDSLPKGEEDKKLNIPDLDKLPSPKPE